jgi:hypothetical protein
VVSVFGWLDQSDEQRRKVLDIIDLFREQGTVDELGLGTIRDAMADILFPGTSNLMTRSSYYLFVPWTYQRLEQQKVPSSEIAAKARREELKLIERLLETGETEGVIGRRARGGLKRLPSSVYWAGMKRLGICQFDGSQDSYHRSLDRFYQRRHQAVQTDDRERIGGGRPNWHARLPEPRPDWPTSARLALAATEAEFVRDQISLSAPASLLAHLVRAHDVPGDVPFPWAHPRMAEFSARILWQLGHAQNISEIMHGAALLYNLILAELTSKDDLEQEYRTKLSEWTTIVAGRDVYLRNWNRGDAWACVESEGGRIPSLTKEFVNRWCDLVLEVGPAAIPGNDGARLLVKNREKRLKGPLARIENLRPRELWQGASSAQRLQFRWSNAAVIIEDVVSALRGTPDA